MEIKKYLESPGPGTDRGRLLWAWVSAMVLFSFLWQMQVICLSVAAYLSLSLLFSLPVLVAELRNRTFSAFLDEAFRSRKKTCLLLFLLTVGLVKFYWIPGYRLYTMGDGTPHFLNCWMVFEALQKGEMPFWTNYWACGSPFLQFYPPLFFFLSAALLFLNDNPFFVIRLLLFLLHVLSSFTMYRFVRALGAHRGAAFVSGVFYILAPWHVFQVFHFNRFPVAAVYTLLPLLFLSAEFVARNRFQAILVGAFSLAGITLSHQGYAIFSAGLFAIYSLLRARPGASGLREYLAHVLCVSLLGLGMASFLWVPHLFEAFLVPFLPSLTKMEGVRGFIMDNPYVATLFLWSRKPIGHTGYLGLSLFALGVLGTCGWVLSRGKACWSLLVCLALSFYLVLGHTNALYSLIPFVYSQFYAGRYLIFLVFFLSVFAGFSLPAMERWTSERQGGSGQLLSFLRGRLHLVCLGLLILDLAPISFYVKDSPRFGTPDQALVYEAIRRKRQDDVLPMARSLDIPKRIESRNHRSLILPFEAGSPTPEAGQFGILASYGYIYKILKTARETMGVQEILNQTIRQGLYLLNVRYVFTDALPEEVARAYGGENFGGPLWLITLPESQPILASNRLELVQDDWVMPLDPVDLLLDRWSPPDLVERIIASMEIDMGAMRAGKILIRGSPAAGKAYAEPPESILVVSQEMGFTWLRLEVSASSDCYLHLSQAFSPSLKVLIDGRPSPEVHQSALGFTVIPFPQGTHAIEILATLSPLRKATLAFSGLLFAFLALLAAGQILRARGAFFLSERQKGR